MRKIGLRVERCELKVESCKLWVEDFFCSPITTRYSPFTTRHSLSFSIRQSPFAVIFGSAGASPSHFAHRLKSVSTKTKPAKAG